jgi:hypothetical protein
MAKVTTLKDVAQRLVEIKKARDELKKQEADLVQENKALIAEALAMMDISGVDSFTVDDTAKITRQANVRGNIESAGQFFEFLSQRKDESLGMLQIDPTIIPPSFKKKIKELEPGQIKIAVAWNRLAAYLKDVCDPLDKATWPPGVKVDFWEDVRVSVK